MRKIFIVILCIIFSLTCIQTINAQHGTSPNWTAQDTLPKPNTLGSATKGGTGQNIVRLSNGDLVQCFSQQFPFPSGPSKIYLMKSTNDGLSWNAPINYTPTTYFSSSFGTTIAKDTADNLHMVWVRKVPYAIFYSKMDANYNVLIDTIKISDYVIEQIGDAPYLTVDRKSRVHVMWHDGDADSTSSASYFTKVMYLRSPDGGATWEAQKLLSDTTVHKHAGFPRANFSGVSGDTLALPWRQQVTSNTNWDVWMTYSVDGGINWIRILAAGTNDVEWDPGIVVDKNNRIHLHYHEYQSGNFQMSQMEYAYTDNLGQTWNPSNPFQTISPSGMRGQLSIFSYDYDADIQCICWKDERDYVNANDTRADVMCSYTADGGLNWQGQEFVTDNDSGSIGFKSVEAGSNGVLYVTYEYNDSAGRKTIYFSKRSTVLTATNTMELQNGITIFPNPSGGKIFFHTNLTKYELKIFDIVGKEIYSTGNHNNNFELNLYDVEAGFYFYKIVSDQNKISQGKLIIK